MPAVLPPDDDDDEFADDADEQEGFQLHSSGPQKVLWPIYLLLILVFIVTATIPLMVMYTLGWQAVSMSKFQ